MDAREAMERLNAEAGKLHIWLRTQANAPAQRPWFRDTGLEAGECPAGLQPGVPKPWPLGGRVGLCPQPDVQPTGFGIQPLHGLSGVHDGVLPLRQLQGPGIEPEVGDEPVVALDGVFATVRPGLFEHHQHRRVVGLEDPQIALGGGELRELGLDRQH